MDINGIIDLCLQNQIDAVFPGWGYLSENPDFCLALEKNGITFMGPSSKTILQLGNKINSMIIAEQNNIPLVKVPVVSILYIIIYKKSTHQPLRRRFF